MEKIRLEDLSSTEVNQAIENGIDTILIIIGSIEQHGSHLPLSTDSLIAEEIGLEIVKKLGNALLAPIIKVGVSEYHMDFAGTISIREETLSDILIDYCKCLIKHGFKNIVMLSTHSGNCRAIDNTVHRLKCETNKAKFIGFADLMGYFDPLFKAAAHFGLSPFVAGTHAGEAETSMILAINPELVEMSRAKTGYMGDFNLARTLIMRKGTKFISENGIFGDPTQASKDHGRAYLSSLVNYFINYIEQRLKE